MLKRLFLDGGIFMGILGLCLLPAWIFYRAFNQKGDR